MSSEQYRRRRGHSDTLKHLFDNSDLNVYDKTFINLSVGAPGPDLLHNCCEIFKKATEHRLEIESRTNSYIFQYGPAGGLREAREEVAKYLSDAYQDKVYCDDLILTTGATQGMHLILSTLIDLNGVIFVDEVTYMIALDAFKQFTGLKLVPLVLNANGVDVQDLRKRILEHKFESKAKIFWAIYYAIPTFHNPTGILFSEEVCVELIKLAREHDILIACDDCYNLLHYTCTTIPKRLFAYDDENAPDYKGHVISNGSFSKIIGPGVRLGWMECPPRCAKALKECGVLKSGGATNNYTSGILTSLLQLGLVQSHIAMMSSKYKERMIAVCQVLKDHIPRSCKFIEPSGGYFIWITLPDSIGPTFNDYLLKNYKVFGIRGDRFSLSGDFKSNLRISIAFHSKEVLVDAVKKICVAIRVLEGGDDADIALKIV